MHKQNLVNGFQRAHTYTSEPRGEKKVTSVIMYGDSAPRMLNACAVMEIKQAHSLIQAHTLWNVAKARVAGVENLLIGCVFLRANLKNKMPSAHQRFSVLTLKAIENSSLEI